MKKYQSLKDVYSNLHKKDYIIESKQADTPNVKTPSTLTEAYKQVLNDARITFNIGDKTEDIEISDENAQELRKIADISTIRNPALYNVDGQWFGSGRLTKKQTKDIYNISKDMQDKGKIQERIVQIAKNAAIYDVDREILSTAEKTGRLMKFIYDSARLTLEERGEERITDRKIKKQVNEILQLIEDKKFQEELITFVDGKSSDDTVTINLWNILKDENDHRISFDVGNNQDMLTLMPAGEDGKTRGAAGPGESLISFIYGGTKPEGAGDILLSSGGDDSIELKKTGGRIGKEITSSDLKKLKNIFHDKTVNKTPTNKSYRDWWNENYPEVKIGSTEKMYRFPNLPNEFYKLAGIKPPVDEKYRGIIPHKIKEKKYNPKNHQELVDKIANNDNFDFTTFINLTKNTFKLKNAPDIPAGYGIAGKIKQDAEQSIDDFTVTSFLNEHSGVTTGSSEVNTSLAENMSLRDALEILPGNTALDKVTNLIGAWHLKYYLTHIQPFKWLLVYNTDGVASGITYDKIIRTPVVELAQFANERGLKFGHRPDKEGYDIQIK